MTDVLAMIRAHCSGLTAEQRADILADAGDLVTSADDLAAVLEALARRGRPVRSLIEEQRAELASTLRPASSERRPTLGERGIRVIVPAETERRWLEIGGTGALGAALLGAHETQQIADAPDRVLLRRRHPAVHDLSAVAVRQPGGELLVIQVARRPLRPASRRPRGGRRVRGAR